MAAIGIKFEEMAKSILS